MLMTKRFYFVLLILTGFSVMSWGSGHGLDLPPYFVTTCSPTSTTMEVAKPFADTTVSHQNKKAAEYRESEVLPFIEKKRKIRKEVIALISGREAVFLQEISKGGGELVDQIIALLECNPELFKARLREKIHLLSNLETKGISIEDNILVIPQTFAEYVDILRHRPFFSDHKSSEKSTETTHFLEIQRLENIAIESELDLSNNGEFTNALTKKKIDRYNAGAILMKNVLSPPHLAERVLLINNFSVAQKPAYCDSMLKGDKYSGEVLTECSVASDYRYLLSPSICSYVIPIENEESRRLNW